MRGVFLCVEITILVADFGSLSSSSCSSVAVADGKTETAMEIAAVMADPMADAVVAVTIVAEIAIAPAPVTAYKKPCHRWGFVSTCLLFAHQFFADFYDFCWFFTIFAGFTAFISRL